MEDRICRSMNILRAGPMLTVQDRGRTGYMKYGIGESGVMDHKSYEEANRLVGNSGDEAVLEATLMGPKIQFESDCLIAVTGADMEASIDDTPIERGRAIKVSAGQTLMMGFAKKGCRAYIAVSGGIDVPVVMESRSTNIKCHIGGYEGRALKDGDRLPLGKENFDAGQEEKLLAQYEAPNDYPEEIQVRVIMGPQDSRFTGNGIVSFLTETYTVSPASDRMGIRLDGQKIESENGTDIISDGIVFGSVQITSDGDPIVLMADHQTTGGYAKIATVVYEDLHLLAQARPGCKVKFIRTDIKNFDNSIGFWNRLSHLFRGKGA